MDNSLRPTGKKFLCAASDGTPYTVIELRKIFDERTRGVSQMEGATVYRIDEPKVDVALISVISGALSVEGLRRFHALEPIGLLTQIVDAKPL